MALAPVWKVLYFSWLLSHIFSNKRSIFFFNLLAELKSRKSFLTFKFFKHLILRKLEETR